MHPQVVEPGSGSCPLCGMALEPRIATSAGERPAELADMSRRFWVSLALSVPVLALAMMDALPGQPLHRAISTRGIAWIQLALAAPVVLWGGLPFFRRGWVSVARRRLNMFTLIALGVGSAFCYSAFATLFTEWLPSSFRAADGGPAVYFEAAAVIVTVVLLGQVLELRARLATSGAIRALLCLAPATAWRLEDDGREEEVSLADVRPGDRLRVRPGDRVPVDGVVLEGYGAVDESMLTGEAIPAEKAPGGAVTGGTLNGNGSLVIRAERVGSETLLAQIVRLVGEARRTRAPIQRLADLVSAYFVPLVLAVAAVAFVLWALLGPEPRIAHAVLVAIAVLIISCPCGLGLATPMSVMVGTGRGAQTGVLIKNAEALETLEKVDTLVVDKTGTLTEGKPRLATSVSVAGFGEQELLRLAAGLERASEHPLAAAIVEGAEQRGIELAPVAAFRALPGKGVVGEVEGREVALGNRELLRERGIAVGELAEQAEWLRRAGQTVVFVAADGRLAGLLGVVDPVKPSAREAVEMLHAQGVRVVMLTGDSRTTAAAVARELGVDETIAEVLPHDKAAVVRKLQQAGCRVAMAGDGINDAPALAHADVGIAMGTGTDVAVESAGITLVRGDLRGIARARRLSRRTMRNIRQNLFFAFVYNAVGVPIAAGLLYPFFGLLLSPLFAGVAMSLSSVSVIGNALRLRHVEL
jgi:Cu+-exporting ATPase